jgi:5-methylcytosine-specific restriction enzyme B
MQILDLLRARDTTSTSVSKIAGAKSELAAIFDPAEWFIRVDVNHYTDANKNNIWKNEMRPRLRSLLEESGKSESDYAAWLGAVHFVNIQIDPVAVSPTGQQNEGWRLSIIALPAAGVIAVGIASHYQNAQAHNALGEASNLLFDLARDGLKQDGGELPGRKIASQDWDGGGLITPSQEIICGVSTVGKTGINGLSLKDVRTTTAKKILASFISIQAMNSGVSEQDFRAEIKHWIPTARRLAAKVPPFTNLKDFEGLRFLALKDITAANLRIQMRKQSATRSILQIYYGPPGTGKTITAVQKSIEIVDPLFSKSARPSDHFHRMNELSGQIAFVTFHPSLQYEDAVESIRPSLIGPSAPGDEANSEADEANSPDPTPASTLNYTVHEGVILKLIRSAIAEPSKEFVILIDEINRGDVSRILGPLISALDSDKRLGAEFPIGVELQYPRAGNLESRLFLPSNLHFIGTMNSADRNIALVDHALRRRFEFISVPSDPTCLSSTDEADAINLQDLLGAMNDRISHFLGSEFEIGHGYFWGRTKNADVISVMARKILPLLSEYFHGNANSLMLVLGEQSGGLFNIFRITRGQDAFESIFNVPREVAIGLGYRQPSAEITLKVDSKFWNPQRLIPGPDDEAYAVKAIKKIYSKAS